MITLREAARAAYEAKECAKAEQEAAAKAKAAGDLLNAINKALPIDSHYASRLRLADNWETGAAGEQIAVIDGIRFHLLFEDLEVGLRFPGSADKLTWHIIKDLAQLGYWLSVANRTVSDVTASSTTVPFWNQP